VPQGEEIAFPMTVREMVAMGRYPHLGPWRREGPPTAPPSSARMEICDVDSMRDRAISTLSGGERQRARIARALAQEPRVLALDEPTVALDVSHEMAIFELLRALCGDGVTVLLVTHNLNLAARYAERLILMENGAVAADGEPRAVLERRLLERVYGWPLHVTQHPGPGPDAGAPQVTPLAGPRDAHATSGGGSPDFRHQPNTHRSE
jgi:iron complex transport system ATP-binding protein